jgi:hypothetical protein
MDEVVLEHTDVRLVNVHGEEVCRGRPCTVHNRSDHHMRSWPQHWRHDRGLMERICSHGVGHPDPDEPSLVKSTHGCDGCCSPPQY